MNNAHMCVIRRSHTHTHLHMHMHCCVCACIGAPRRWRRPGHIRHDALSNARALADNAAQNYALHCTYSCWLALSCKHRFSLLLLLLSADERQSWMSCRLGVLVARCPLFEGDAGWLMRECIWGWFKMGSWCDHLIWCASVTRWENTRGHRSLSPRGVGWAGI